MTTMLDVWSRRVLRVVLGMMLAITLAACGGGGGSAGTPVVGPGSGASGPTTGTEAATITVTISTTAVTAAAPGTVKAVVKDASGNLVSGQLVNFTTSLGLGVFSASSALTDSTGTATVTVIPASSSSNGADYAIASATVGSSTTAVTGQVGFTTTAIATPTAAKIEITASATHVGAGGDSVVVTAYVKDLANNALASTPVSFSASTGTLSSVSASTSSAGLASATFSAGSDKSNRSATITVTSGGVTNTITLPIDGTALTLSGPSSLILNDQTTFDVVVTDSRSNVVPGVAVTVASALGNSFVATSSNISDANGQVRFNYSATKAGADSLTFSGAGVTKVSPLAISGVNFSFTSPAASTVVPVDGSQTLKVKLLVTGSAAGKTVNFAATGGKLNGSTLPTASVVTDSNGEATVTISSSSAGPITVQASVDANGDGNVTTTTLPLVIAATTPSRLVLQATPAALAPNTGTSTSNQAQVIAKVTDAKGNPVQGQTVNFSRNSDPSGGDLLQVSAVTDASGQAKVYYRSGSESTASGGVVLGAVVSGYPSATGTTTLTVNQSALFIALGTGNVISKPDAQTYQKNWVAYVTDANGIPVDGVTLTVKAVPNNYRTGQLVEGVTTWGYWSPIYSCRNEDANTDGILGSGEDDNGDGKLWPGNVIAVAPNTVQTANGGMATITLTYAQSYALWVDLKLTVSAIVSGTESKNEANFIVPANADDMKSGGATPANQTSPFGPAPTAAALTKTAPVACLLVQ